MPPDDDIRLLVISLRLKGKLEERLLEFNVSKFDDVCGEITPNDDVVRGNRESSIERRVIPDGDLIEGDSEPWPEDIERLAVPMEMSMSGSERSSRATRLKRVATVSTVTSCIDAFKSNELPGENDPLNVASTFSYIKSAETPNVRDFHGDVRAKAAENETPES